MKNMNDVDPDDLLGSLEDLEEIHRLPPIRNAPLDRSRHQKNAGLQRKPRRSQAEVMASLVDDDPGGDTFEFTYHASRHEREWLVNSLGGFHESRWFDDVLRLLKGGKEASVYQCAANPSVKAAFIAAKVYRPRRFRNLKNDHLYREGRAPLDADGNVILNGGMLHAMAKRTEYGLQLSHTSWIEHEYITLRMLHAAGADVPKPYACGDNAILMEYIGGPSLSAPSLNEVQLTSSEAKLLFQQILHNVELTLAQGRVHGDLSAYNVLYWEGKIKLIDFPQSIDPFVNRSAHLIFQRDMTRICEYFQRQGVYCDSRQLAKQLWIAHGYRLRPEVHPRFLDSEDDSDLEYWKNLEKSD